MLSSFYFETVASSKNKDIAFRVLSVYSVVRNLFLPISSPPPLGSILSSSFFFMVSWNYEVKSVIQSVRMFVASSCDWLFVSVHLDVFDYWRKWSVGDKEDGAICLRKRSKGLLVGEDFMTVWLWSSLDITGFTGSRRWSRGRSVPRTTLSYPIRSQNPLWSCHEPASWQIDHHRWSPYFALFYT